MTGTQNRDAFMQEVERKVDSDDMTRDEAVELILIHAVACSEFLFKGLVPQEVSDALDPRAKVLTNQYGEGLVERTRAAFEILAATPPPDSYRDLDDLGGADGGAAVVEDSPRGFNDNAGQFSSEPRNG